MDHEQIIGAIRQALGGPSSGAAEHAAGATLLTERLPRAETRHIQQELPAELAPWVCTETEAEAFDIDEFLNGVTKRQDPDIQAALLHARAAFSVLDSALSPKAGAHLTAALPKTFDPLIAEAQYSSLESWRLTTSGDESGNS